MKPTQQFFSTIRIATLAIACLSFGTFTVSAQSPSFSESFTLSNGGNLDVSTSGGHIYVEGSSGNSVEVEVFVKKNGKILPSSHELVENIEEGFEMTMEKQGNTVVLEAKRRKNMSEWRRVSISFEIKSPTDISTELKTSGGGLRLANVEGEHFLSTSGGSIRLNDVSGETKANTSGGSIKVANQDGDLKANTSGGSIDIMDSEGDMYARTSGGGIKLENNKGAIDASTSGGTIRISGRAESIEASTSGGSIYCDVSGLSERLSLRTSGGSIHATIPSGLGMDLDIKGGRVNVEANNFSGTMKKNRVYGSMNGGGMPIQMSTSGGSVNLDFH